MAVWASSRWHGRFLHEKFERKPEILKANLAALHAGWNYGETTEDFRFGTKSSLRRLPKARTATSAGTLRCRTASLRRVSRQSCRCTSGPYPIT